MIMSDSSNNHFDEAAATWDAEPRRVELTSALGKAILRQVQPNRGMDVRDYGCGTGLPRRAMDCHIDEFAEAVDEANDIRDKATTKR
jgi:hypothetical protein